MLNYYDTEVFPFDWLVVIINPVSKEKIAIVNDKQRLEEYYNKHKSEIWLGYNSRNYDTYIIKAILCGFNPYAVSRFIIHEKKAGWKYSDLFRNIQLYDYDVMVKDKSLKQLEGFMGSKIKETSVPFDIDRKLTAAEIAEELEYCTNDVEQLIEVFLRKKNEFDTHLDLIKIFNLSMDYISKTQAQLTAAILDCTKTKRDDEWDLEFVDTLQIKKYKHILDWFKNPKNQSYENAYETEVCGVPHTFAWGGLHGCANAMHYKGVILHLDVTSFYPSIMIRYNMLTRNSKSPEKYKQIYDKRLALKKAGLKKEQKPYKTLLNTTYGISGQSVSSAYDPRQRNSICVNGQLLLLDLLEHLEGHCEVIQSNTDGLYVQIDDTDKAFSIVDDICYEWECRTGVSLEFENVTEMWQKDVHNYIAKFEDGSLVRKGSYVKNLSDLDYDLPIINEALVNKLVYKIPVEKTINDCTELRKFQKIVKIQGSYNFAWHNEKVLDGKVFRVFASKLWHDTYIAKCKGEGMTLEKFANTPDNCFIINDSVKGMPIPAKLDKNYYIELSYKRLTDYGETANERTI